MEIKKEINGTSISYAITGRIDTLTAPMLEAELNSGSAGMDELNLDFAGVEYISSAGLRVLLAIQKAMNNSKGKMTLSNVSSSVMEIFDITGFVDILTII